MAQLALPKPPYENRHAFTRHNEQFVVVEGLGEDGLEYGWIEKVELAKGIYKARLEPTRGYNVFKGGKIVGIETYWAWHFYNPTTMELEKVEDTPHHPTIYADLIYFSAGLGSHVMKSMMNGAVRGPIMGFNAQPIFDQTGAPIDDVVAGYDVTLAPDKFAYEKVEPAYVVEETIEPQP